MKKIQVRKTETLKTTAAAYGCSSCDCPPDGDILSGFLSLFGLS